ncbi:MAG: type VI secretion system tube protein Hcp [Chthoniobacteraceae bacterium]
MNTHRLPSFRHLAVVLVTGLFLTATIPRCLAQVSIYARFLDGTGVWAGESSVPGRTGWTDLKSGSFGASIPVTIGGGGTVGRASFDNIVLSKVVDRLTPQIFANLSTGTSLNGGGANGDATIEFVRTVNATPVVFFRYELRSVFFTKSLSSSIAGDATLSETVTMVANAVRYTYWPILPNGTQGTPIIKMWNVVANNATF